jgi:transcriptional antiterminator NusG
MPVLAQFRERTMHEASWNVLHVVANHEKQVAKHLSARSVEHYLPVYSERSQWKDRRVEIERPLFKGYVFIRYNPLARLAVLTTPGVIRLLGEGQSQIVSSEELDRIREGLASGCRLRPHPFISVGSRVRVRDGIFGGVTGVVTELRQQCKIVIGLASIQQCFSLELGFDEVEVMSEAPLPAARFLRPLRFAQS